MSDNVFGESSSVVGLDRSAPAVSKRIEIARAKIVRGGVEDDPSRLDVIRDVAVFQLKLAVDGVRDIILSPISIVAGIIGIILGGRHARVPFQQVLRFGRHTERWIDLFGTHREAGDFDENAASLDGIAETIEGIIRKDYADGGVSAATRARIDELVKGFARQHENRSPKGRDHRR